MQNVEMLIHARWLIPIIPRNLVLDYHSIAVNHNKIIAILPTSEAKKHYHADKVHELNDHVVLPGFVNSHAHSPMTLFRGLADDLKLMDWLENHIWPAEVASINPDFIRDGMQLAMAEMLLSGTTCFNEHYFYPDIIAQCVAEAGMRACVGMLIMSVPTPYSQTAEEAFQKAEHCLAKGAPNSLIQFSLGPHSPYATDDSILLKIKKLSEEMNLLIHMHIHETADEVERGLKEYNKRPMQRLAELDFLSPRLQAVHMTQTTEEDIKLLKQSGAHVVHCPEGNLKLSSGCCPVQKIRHAGINIAIGTDGAASNNNLDMFGEMRTAALLGKMVANDPTATSATDVLEMATLGGAKALHLEHEIGSLETGKSADFIAVNLNEVNTQPVYNPISQLVYACHSTQVTDVWIAGKQLVKNKQLQTINQNQCLAIAQSWQSKLESHK